MGYTDSCDVFAAFHEDGFNRIIRHIQRQRPSLFNYGTPTLAGAAERMCRPIDAHPIVTERRNPRVTIVDLLPIPGTAYGLDFCVQLQNLEIDFHPGNVFPLPAELSPPLKPQRLAIRLRLCAGIACPSGDMLDGLVPPPRRGEPGKGKDDKPPEKPKPTPIPFKELRCFCLEAILTAGVRLRTYDQRPYVEPFLDGFEIIDIAPKDLEDSIECYIKTMLKLSVLPGLRIVLESMPLDIIKDSVQVSVGPMPTGAALPFNPAIEDNQIKAFLKVEVV